MQKRDVTQLPASRSREVSVGVFIGCLTVCGAAGLLTGHPARWVRWGPVAWLTGILAAAALGAFAATSEDSTVGVFVFTGAPTILWVVAAIAGSGLSSLIRR